MRYTILGPLEVREQGTAVPLGGAKQRALLALLLLHPNETVTRERLIDELWGSAPPASASHSVEVYVSQLRKTLPANGDQPLETHPRGYALHVGPGELDLAEFERLAKEGRRAAREGDAAAAADRLREALALWHGPPLADVSFESAAAYEVARLQELRVAALEERIDADLALGRHRDLVPELERLVGEEPLRERPRAQLMLALYRSGRQAEALEVYADARRTFVSELGIEPGVDLQRLQKAILEHDPALESPPAPEEAAARLRARTHQLLAVIASALVVAGLALAGLLFFGQREHALAHIDPNAVGLLDAKSGAIRSEVVLGLSPTAAAAGGDAVWVTHFSDNRVSRVDQRTRTVRQTLVVGNGPSGIAYGVGSIWVANLLDATVSRIDPVSNMVVQTIPVGSGPSGVAFGLGAVWVANSSDHSLSRIDARSGLVTAVIAAGGDATAVAVDHGAVWTANTVAGTVSRIDPRTRTITATIHVGNGPEAIAAGAGAIWVANGRDGTVSRIDPRTNAVTATTRVGAGPIDISMAGDAVWVADEFDDTLWRLDARSGAVGTTHELGAPPRALATAADGVWVAAGPALGAHRGGTAFTEVPLDRIDVDSAIAYDAVAWSILSSTSDGLTGVKRTGGSLQLVPDLALALPSEMPTRRWYTFTLRDGLRYSTGARVRASDFRRAIERDFKLNSPGAQYYTNIAGAAACRPKACVLARGIVTDDAARTVTFRLSKPDPEFLWKLALPFAYPVPAGAPNAVQDSRPIPGTGPYLIAVTGPKELRLVRNRLFRVWSKAARPDGYPDEIVFALRGPRLDDAAAIRAVDRGKLDWISWTEPSTAHELLLHHRARLHVNPWLSTTYMALNTRVPPFDDVRVRRALNYAVDRSAMVEQEGGPLFASPTCQVLPPGFPGYRRYCPYAGPDLAKARRLVATSGTKGMSVTVWTMAPLATDSGRYFVSTLRRLGYSAKLKELPSDAAYFRTIADSRNEVQIAWNASIADYPSASNFINVLLSCSSFEPTSPANNNVSGFCDRRIDTHIRSALSLEATNRRAANALWARIDREITDQAPWVAKTNHNFVALVSRRVGNYQFNPQLGMLIDQLWVR